MAIEQSIEKIMTFVGSSLSVTLCDYEKRFCGLNRTDSEELCEKFKLESSLISSALAIKKVAAQINTIIHAVGILLVIPRILSGNERIISLSLGAGNTGKKFDLETNIRVAEFKFINWQGRDTKRQDSLFEDFYKLAEYSEDKKCYLYVLGKQFPLKFLRGSRAIKSVLNKKTLSQEFVAKYGDKFKVVKDYYLNKKRKVIIKDIANILPELKD